MQTIGKEVESLVSIYLQQQGLKLLEANYRCNFGEIDLIMDDNDTLVFIEVRYRNNLSYGDGVVSINKSKQHKIKRTAIYYLQQHALYDKVICRFDIVAVAKKSKEDLIWIKDAFWAKW
jgi:putative endonuclease